MLPGVAHYGLIEAVMASCYSQQREISRFGAKNSTSSMHRIPSYVLPCTKCRPSTRISISTAWAGETPSFQLRRHVDCNGNLLLLAICSHDSRISKSSHSGDSGVVSE